MTRDAAACRWRTNRMSNPYLGDSRTMDCTNTTDGKFRIDGAPPDGYRCAGDGWTAPPLNQTATRG